MRVLLTGGTGFLGSHVAERLCARGHDVVCTVRKASDRSFLETLHVDFAEADVTDEEALGSVLEGVDALVHVAGAIAALNEEGFRRVNTEGTRNLIEAVRRHKPSLQRFVYTSSIAARGPDGPDDGPGAPVSAYGRSKAEAEESLRQVRHEFPVTILRPPVLYGPRDHGMLPVFKAVRLRLLPVMGSGHRRLSCCYGPDVAEATCLALEVEHPSGSIYTLSDGTDPSWRELVRGIGAAGAIACRAVPMPGFVYRVAGATTSITARVRKRPAVFGVDKVREMAAGDWVCGSEAIECDLGWRPAMPQAEAFEATWEWYRASGWL